MKISERDRIQTSEGEDMEVLFENNGDCRRAFELKKPAYHRWCMNHTALNCNLFCKARNTGNRLYAAVKDRYSVSCCQNFDDCASAYAWCRTLKVMCLVGSQMFLLFVLLVVLLCQI